MNYRLGLIGHPVSHSLSPPMHRAALRHFGLEGDYVLLDVPSDQLNEKVKEFICGEGLVGFNVTIPHKEAVFALASAFTPEAEAARAANTVKVLGKRLLAHNTDIEGFRLSLEETFATSGFIAETAVILGAGGAARAALIALDQFKLREVVLVARNQNAAKAMLDSVKLSHRHRVAIAPLPAAAFGAAHSLVINTTPIGQKSAQLPQWLNYIFTDEPKDGRLLFDTVYARTQTESNPDTPLVAYARSRRWQAVDGTNMLVHQAKAAFLFWTGFDPPFSLMRAALDQARERA